MTAAHTQGSHTSVGGPDRPHHIVTCDVAVDSQSKKSVRSYRHSNGCRCYIYLGLWSHLKVAPRPPMHADKTSPKTDTVLFHVETETNCGWNTWRRKFQNEKFVCTRTLPTTHPTRSTFFQFVCAIGIPRVVGGEKELENVEVFARECTQRSCRSCCVCRFELKITQDCNETLRESWEDSFWWLWDHHWHCLCERKTRDVVCLRQKRVWRCIAFGWT